MKTRLTFSAIFVLSILTFFSCKKETKVEVDTFSSPKTLFVEYVSAYTSGFVSKNSEVTVKLTKPVSTAEVGKEVDQKVFSFDPDIKGQAIWEDDRTIVFKPETELAGGQRYKTVFLLNKLIEIPSDKGEFRFTFECIPQNFNVNIEGISVYDVKDLSRVKLTGTIQTADQITKEQAKQLVKAEQDGKSLTINYEYGIGQNLHGFIIEDVERTDEEGAVDIEWNGAAIGVDKKDDAEYTIPSLLDFKVTSIQVMRAADKYISVKFSDPINDKQNLRGLVTLSKSTAPRLVVNLNELKIYATSKLDGEVDLTIDKSIRNTAGYTLQENYEEAIKFSQQKPEVKITANKGVIMPSSEGLIVPFEAISLSAVDLTIVRIFEDNVLQYLQVNQLGGNYQLQRVGRPVARQTETER